jgi:hypothetical protein
VFEPDYRPEPEHEQEREPESRSGDLLGWLSIVAALLAIPALAEPSTLLVALAFAIAAIVLGMKGLSRNSAPVAAGFGLGLGIGEVLVVGLLFWFVSAVEGWS